VTADPRTPVKVGVILPTFTATADEARDVARRADMAGVDGVFCYDHLWPMGRPDRPALAPFPVLAAVAATTTRVAVGTLVARVGLVPDRVLLSEIDALSALAPGRVVIALGTGDRLSAAENRAYGIPFAPPADRRRSLRYLAGALRDREVPVWVGGGAPETLAVAEEEGAAVNLWDASPEQVAAQARRTEVTWAGPSPAPGGSTGRTEAPDGPAALGRRVGDLAAAGATWVVVGWPAPLDALVTWARRSDTGR
jgi:alkanesulfonate monooxygenase SsuD/methylene tetrahydromethanopterin reductase-like flavin-dependent oxidoreductase (luciferase family)